MEHLASCSKLTPKHSHSLSALSDQDSDDHPSAETRYMQAASAVEQEGFGQCSFCKRKFLCTRLEKHMSICGRNQDSKRKVFDSSKARTRGTELEQYQQRKSSRSPQVTCSPFASLDPHLLCTLLPLQHLTETQAPSHVHGAKGYNTAIASERFLPNG